MVVFGFDVVPCYHPLHGWRSRTRNESGKRGIVFSRIDGFVDLPVVLPCGQCIGCRLERSRQWAMRCMHEASRSADNVFVTLTYDDEHLPASGSLIKRDFQLFMKRVRRRFSGLSIRYFHCGEYGDVSNRPHYHAIIFGLDFPDKVLLKESAAGGRIFISEVLSSLWSHGFCTLGDVTFESCAYVARYVLKKRTGKFADKHYERVVDETGEIVQVLPEYTTMSLKPAIGRRWFEEFHKEVFPVDEVIMRGKRMKPPKYYSGLHDIADHEDMERIKGARVKEASKRKGDSTPERLKVRERVKRAQISMLKRSVE